MTSGKQQPRYFPTLDGWRAVAIVAVIMSHSHQLVEPQGIFPSPAWRSVLAHFRVGVDLFFAISGFLITQLLVQESLQTGTISLRSFYVRRAFRILPVIIAYLLVVALLA